MITAQWGTLAVRPFQFSWQVLTGARYEKYHGEYSGWGSVRLFLKLLTLRFTLLSFGLSAPFVAIIRQWPNSAPVELIFGYMIALTFVALEEQGRWIFAKCHRNLVMSQVKFYVMTVIVESISFFPYGTQETLWDYFFVRLTALLVGGTSSVLCVLSYRYSYKTRVKLVITAVAIHLWANKSGAAMIYQFFVPDPT